MNEINGILSVNEKNILMELLSDLSSGFTSSLSEAFSEEIENYKPNERIIIKKNYDIFKFDEDVFTDLHNAIQHKTCLNLIKQDGMLETDVSPVGIFFKEEFESWYLEYWKKHKQKIILLDKISSVSKSLYPYKGGTSNTSGWKMNSEPHKVIIRVFDEDNKVVISLRHLFGKRVKEISSHEKYTDIELIVEDINMFERWVRSKMPSVLVLYPEKLKKSIIDEAKSLLDKMSK